MSDSEKATEEKSAAAAEARRLLSRARQASLATALARDASGWPYASLVLLAPHRRLGPLLLLSRLAEHTQNLFRDNRASLLVRSEGAKGDPLAQARVTLLGRLLPVEGDDEAEARATFLAAHPEARLYAGFGDFGLYRLVPERAHLVAGFGRIHWLEAGELESA
jgi:putative heme iron utilization protein